MPLACPNPLNSNAAVDGRLVASQVRALNPAEAGLGKVCGRRVCLASLLGPLSARVSRFVLP